MRNSHGSTWNMGRYTEKRAKWETNTIGHVIWRETVKTWSMRNTISMTRIVARKLKKLENETETLYDLEYGEKHWKTCKMIHTLCRNWNMARKLTHEETEKLTWWDMKYGKKQWKTCEMRNTFCRTWNMARNTEKR